MLDVARFKYPSHWMSLRTVYDSFRQVDLQSGLTRGFLILSRDSDMFTNICRIGQDYPLVGEFTRFFKDPARVQAFQQLAMLHGREFLCGFLHLLNDSPPKFLDLLTLFVIQISFSLDSHSQKTDQLLQKELDLCLHETPNLVGVDLTPEDTSKHLFLEILSDYEEKKAVKILALMYCLFRDELLGQKPAVISKIRTTFHHCLFL